MFLMLKGLNMIKRKKSICLAIAALSAVSLSGCSSVTNNTEGYILTYTYNGKDLTISTREIINRYLNQNRNDHAAAFYNALNEVVIRRAFAEGGVLSAFSATVDAQATDEVNKAKDDADDNGQRLRRSEILQQTTDVPNYRHILRRPRSKQVFVQLARRCMSPLQGTRLRQPDRPWQGNARHVALHPQGCHSPLRQIQEPDDILAD